MIVGCPDDLQVRSPFFLTFADFHHRHKPTSEDEWRDDPRRKRMYGVAQHAHGLPLDALVRPQEFYPAWYLFK